MSTEDNMKSQLLYVVSYSTTFLSLVIQFYLRVADNFYELKFGRVKMFQLHSSHLMQLIFLLNLQERYVITNNVVIVKMTIVNSFCVLFC